MAPTSYLLFFFIVSHLVLLHSAEKEKTYLPSCPPFFCGILGNISFPFSGFSRYDRCGLFSINCDEPLPKIRLGNQQYEAIRISQSSDHTILVHDPLLAKRLHSHSCSSFENQITLPDHPFVSSTITHNLSLFKCYRNPELNPQTYQYFNGYRNYSECDDYDIYYTLPKDNQSTPPGTVPYQCRVIQLPVSPSNMNQRSGNLFTLLVAQFSIELHVSSDYEKCVSKGGDYYIGERGYECFTPNNGIPRVLMIKVAIATSASGIGIVVVLVCFFLRRKFNLVSFFRREFNLVSFFRRTFNLVVSFFRRKSSLVFWKKETKNHKIVEAFLRNCGTLTPKRYSYSNIKKMTDSFKDKLGQGGFGVVYKGKLQDGCLVAVKVLNESKGNGEEFINEVASISRTSHVNIVALLGFCFEGSRSALIYEFMPNGSLEKFIYDENPSKTDRKLGWETLYQIAVGIAQGLEYLHRGCNTQILHFDIKPHNILLDEDFCPKISDFGLAKLCSRKESIVSMLVPRGTIGYTAPEVCCRDIGGVSHKSDVYSYGMMILEMIGGRKNLNVGADQTSEIYFPHWIYKRLELDEELELHGIMNEDEKESARKMIIVGLWCIQTDPSNRPPMSRVVNMLEGSLESLEIPPKPFLSSPSRSPADSSSTTLV